MALDPYSKHHTHPAYRRWVTSSPAQGLINSSWRSILNTDKNLKDVILCIELVFGDKPVRIASRRCRSTSGKTGVSYEYIGLITQTPQLEDSYQVGDATSRTRTMTIGLPNRIVDIQTLIKNGRSLAGVCEVSLQTDGMDYDNRYVVLRGDMADGVAFGTIDQVVEVTITDPKDTADTTVPPYVISPDISATVPDESIGQRYAIVLPEYDNVPAPFYHSTRVLACHDHLTITGSVNVDGTYYSSGSAIYPWSTSTDFDQNGVPFTYINFTGGASGLFEGNEQVYVNISGGKGGDSPLTQIRHLLENYTGLGIEGVSDLLFAAALAKAESIQSKMLVNGSGGGTVTGISFIESEFLRSFPMISMVWHASGYGPVWTDRRSKQVSMNLTAGIWPLYDRASYVEESPRSDCFNEFTFQYKYDPLEDAYAGVITRDASNSAMCALSLEVVGPRVHPVIESRFIFDDSTAEAVVEWMVDHMSLTSFYVEYDASSSMYMRVKLGDNIKLTDDDFGWSGVSATVEKVNWTPGQCKLGLRVWSRYYTLGGGAVDVG